MNKEKKKYFYISVKADSKRCDVLFFFNLASEFWNSELLTNLASDLKNLHPCEFMFPFDENVTNTN
jgi:hypothetical protein